MTIGKKIALGFGAVILIAGLLGGIAVLNMNLVQTHARTLATEYVPESQIASDLASAFANAFLNMRTYSLTADTACLDATRKDLQAVHQQQAAAQKLADAHPELVKLRANLKEFEPALQH